MSFPQILPIYFGIMVIILRLPGLVYPHKFKKVFSDLLKSEDMMRLMGLFITIPGLILVLMWEFYIEGVYIILPIIGALLFFLGTNIIWMPHLIYKKILKPILELNDEQIRAICLIKILIACWIVYLGFNY